MHKIKFSEFLIIGIIFGMLSTLTGSDPFVLGWIATAAVIVLATTNGSNGLFRRLSFALTGSLVCASITNNTSTIIAPYLLVIVSNCAIFAFTIALIKRWPSDGYSALFNAVWDTLVKATIALLFIGAAWGIIVLCNVIMTSVGIHLLTNVIDSYYFSYPFTCMMTAIGFYIGERNMKAVRQLRDIILMFCQFSLIALSFMGSAVVLVVTASVLLQHSVTTTSIITAQSIVALHIILLNGAFQHQNGLVKLSSTPSIAVKFFTIAAPFFLLLTLIPVFVSTGSLSLWRHGLTSINAPLLMSFTVLFMYSVTYSISIMRNRKIDIEKIGSSNIKLAWLLIILSIMINNPVSNVWMNRLVTKVEGKQLSTPAVERKQSPTEVKLRAIALKKAAINWQSPSTSSSPFILGVNEKPTYLCKTVFNNKNVFGYTKNHFCVFTNNKSVLKSKNFTILNGNKNYLKWGDAYAYRANKFELTSNKTVQFQVCRTIIDNHIAIGFKSHRETYCMFAQKETVVARNPFDSMLQMLYLRTGPEKP